MDVNEDTRFGREHYASSYIALKLYAKRNTVRSTCSGFIRTDIKRRHGFFDLGEHSKRVFYLDFSEVGTIQYTGALPARRSLPQVLSGVLCFQLEIRHHHLILRLPFNSVPTPRRWNVI